MNESPKIKRRYTRKWKARKESWLGKQEGGVRVRDDVAGPDNQGLYVFLMKYDWGPGKDGKPMAGEKLTIAPYYEVDGEIRWKGRARAAPQGKLKFQHDLVTINTACGYKLAQAIRAVVGEQGITEEQAEADTEAAEKKKREAELDDKIRRLM